MPAQKLEDVFRFFQSKPIERDEFDSLYVNTDKGRGGNPVFKALKRRIVNQPDGAYKMLVSGHKGSGKSTELIRLQQAIENDFIVLNFSVARELDILNINYIELFIVAMEKLFDFVRREERIILDKKYFEDIRGWMQSGEIKEINRNYLGMDIDAGVKAGLKVPFLADFFAKFRAAAKSSASMEKTLVQRIEPKLSELIFLCNRLVGEVKAQLSAINKKGLVIIAEDLDKIDLQRGEDIFYIHSTQLTQLDCHCVFTFPIALLYKRVLKSHFFE